jgi:hypothetical protein
MLLECVDAYVEAQVEAYVEAYVAAAPIKQLKAATTVKRKRMGSHSSRPAST